MADFICKTCGSGFRKKLTLKEKSENYVPGFCGQRCAESYRIEKAVKVTKVYRTPQSSKEEKEFGALIRSFFPSLESQYRLPQYDHHYDFYSPELKLLIEYNGEYWHNKPKQRVKDRKFLNEAKKAKVKLCVITDKDWKLFMESGMPDKKKLLKLLNYNIKNA